MANSNESGNQELFIEGLVDNISGQGYAEKVSADTLKSLSEETTVTLSVENDNYLTIAQNGTAISEIDMDSESFPEEMMETLSGALNF